MIEFLSNIGIWLWENRDGILVTLTSSQFLGIIASMVLIWRNSRRTTENTVSSNELNSSLKNNVKVSEDAAGAKENSDKILTLFETFSAKVDNDVSLLTDKINAIIEVQSIVYSTIKDEKVRNTVSNLLMNAKYSETNTRMELKKQIEELKNQVVKKANEVSEFVEQASEAVAAIVSVDSVEGDKETEVIERY